MVETKSLSVFIKRVFNSNKSRLICCIGPDSVAQLIWQAWKASEFFESRRRVCESELRQLGEQSFGARAFGYVLTQEGCHLDSIEDRCRLCL